MLADPMTRAHAFKELDRRIVKRLHEILENADGTSEPLETFHPNLVKQLSAEFEMDFAECEGFGNTFVINLKFFHFHLHTKLRQWVKSAHFGVKSCLIVPCAAKSDVSIKFRNRSHPNYKRLRQKRFDFDFLLILLSRSRSRHVTTKCTMGPVLSREFDHPDLLVTFACNPAGNCCSQKWYRCNSSGCCVGDKYGCFGFSCGHTTDPGWVRNSPLRIELVDLLDDALKAMGTRWPSPTSDCCFAPPFSPHVAPQMVFAFNKVCKKPTC